MPPETILFSVTLSLRTVSRGTITWVLGLASQQPPHRLARPIQMVASAWCSWNAPRAGFPGLVYAKKAPEKLEPKQRGTPGLLFQPLGWAGAWMWVEKVSAMLKWPYAIRTVTSGLALQTMWNIWLLLPTPLWPGPECTAVGAASSTMWSHPKITPSGSSLKDASHRKLGLEHAFRFL